ncbi:DUF5681 domain-containing protein [Roseomonas sp. CAU 1739]|uniref:DUF5681 domain-containing protein n=1 Tax=Roseomonas sp. CAU 1739 TaxID=3140364 RepID=UPI00325BA334
MDGRVGYGRPPTHTQFKPGQSGNPKGRPSGSANITTLIEETLNEKVPVTEGGRRRSITKAKAIAKQLVNKAARGDLQATRLLLPQQKAAAANPQQAEPNTSTNASATSAPTPSIDYSKLTTAEMEKLYEAALIIEGQRKERPPPPLPPGDPEDTPTKHGWVLPIAHTYSHVDVATSRDTRLLDAKIRTPTAKAISGSL